MNFSHIKPVLSPILAASLAFSNFSSAIEVPGTDRNDRPQQDGPVVPEISTLPRNMRVDAFLRGERVYAAEDPNTAVDEKTLKDLEFERALLPYIEGIAASELGRLRLRYLMTHPLQEREDIIERQNLIRLLANNPAVLERLNEIFKLQQDVISELSGQSMISLIRGFKDSNYGRLGSAQATMLMMLASMNFSMIGMAVATGEPYVASFLVQMGPLGAMAGAGMRRVLMNPAVHRINQLSGELVTEIRKLDLTDQRTLAGALSVCEGQAQCLRKLHQTNANMLQGRIWPFLADGLGVAAPVTIRYAHLLRNLMPELVTWLGALGEIEAYAALADFYRTNSEALVFPEILSSTRPIVQINQGHLPYLRFTDRFRSFGNDVAFNVQLDADAGNKTLILTGPNAGGKTVYLRMMSTDLIMGQTGAPIPARWARFTPTSIFTNFTNERDSTTEGLSTFQAQSRRIAFIQAAMAREQMAGRFSLVALDEILVGTSENEHKALEWAVAEDIHSMRNTLGIIATHYRSLTEFTETVSGAQNLHVTLEGYTIEPGPSTDYNAIEVSGAQGVSPSVLNRARVLLDEYQQKARCGLSLGKEP